MPARCRRSQQVASPSPGKGFFGAGSSPLVDDGGVIVEVGGKDGAGIVAFDAATGKVLWQATNDEASYGCPGRGEPGRAPPPVGLDPGGQP